MEATTATRRPVPGWLAALVPLVLLGALIAVFLALDAPGLERNGVPVEEVAVERTELHPGEIELTPAETTGRTRSGSSRRSSTTASRRSSRTTTSSAGWTARG